MSKHSFCINYNFIKAFSNFSLICSITKNRGKGGFSEKHLDTSYLFNLLFSHRLDHFSAGPIDNPNTSEEVPTVHENSGLPLSSGRALHESSEEDNHLDDSCKSS